jgi:hypothetical protein
MRQSAGHPDQTQSAAHHTFDDDGIYLCDRAGWPHNEGHPATPLSQNEEEMTLPSLGKTDLVLQRIRGEYLEMPGLRLTVKQACRFWSLDEQTCARLLESLVDAGFLARVGQDGYCLGDGVRKRPPALRH